MGVIEAMKIKACHRPSARCLAMSIAISNLNLNAQARLVSCLLAPAYLHNNTIVQYTYRSNGVNAIDSQALASY